MKKGNEGAKISNIFQYDCYNAQKHVLGEVLPLTMPYTVQININNTCNFKCYYCVKSCTKEEQEKAKVFEKTMSFLLYKKIIDRISKAGHLKMLLLQGWGEPLLHQDLCKMIRYAKEVGVADVIRVISNGSLLTKQMSDQLIESGLDSLKISLQGLNSEDYKKVSKIELDFPSFVENIEYFYQHKKNTQLIIKIMDIMIQDRKELFYEIFQGIGDELAVESLIPIVKSIDYKKYNIDDSRNLLNGQVLYSDICSSPFFRLHIDVDGNAVPCCAVPTPFTMGNVAEMEFKQIWNAKVHRSFLLALLAGRRREIPICKECEQYVFGLIPCETLDEYCEDLQKKYRSMLVQQEGEIELNE